MEMDGRPFSFRRAPGSSHAPCGEKLTQKASFFRASRDHVGTRAWFAPPNARSVRRVWREGAESVPGREFRMAPSLIRQLRGDRSDCLPIRRRVFRRGGFSPSPKIVRRPVLSEKIARASEISERSPACDFFGLAGVRKIAISFKKACAHDSSQDLFRSADGGRTTSADHTPDDEGHSRHHLAGRWVRRRRRRRRRKKEKKEKKEKRERDADDDALAAAATDAKKSSATRTGRHRLRRGWRRRRPHGDQVRERREAEAPSDAPAPAISPAPTRRGGPRSISTRLPSERRPPTAAPW